MTERDRSQAAEQRGMLRFIPICRELIRRSDDDRIALKGEGLRRLEPSPKRLFRKLAAGAVQDARPNFVRRERHNDVDNFWEAGERSYPGRVEKANEVFPVHCFTARGARCSFAC